MQKTNDAKKQKEMEVMALEEFSLMNGAMFQALFLSPETKEMISNFLNKITGIKKETFLNTDYVDEEYFEEEVDKLSKYKDIVINLNEHKQFVIEEKKIGYIGYVAVTIIEEDFYKRNDPILDFRPRSDEGIIENDAYVSYYFIPKNVINNSEELDDDLVDFAKFLCLTTLKELEEYANDDEEKLSIVKRIKEIVSDQEFIERYKASEVEERKLMEKIQKEINGKK